MDNNLARSLSLLSVSVLLFCSSCVHTVHRDTTSLEALFKDAAGVVFVEYNNKGEYTGEYAFRSEVITNPQLISEWRQALADASPADWRSAPLVGYFTDLLFLDHEQNPVAGVSITNWKCMGRTFAISHYRSKKNSIVVDWRKNKHNGFWWQSEPFVRSVYNYMQQNRAEELQKKRDEKGRLSLEKLLFEGDDNDSQ